jgi:SAM-dependent methyltransferase
MGGRVVGRAMGALYSGIRGLFGGPVARMIGELGLHRNARILDVGCGSGGLLDRLSRVGFDNLCGADPFIDADSATPEGVPLLKRQVEEVPGRFDLVMFNHSLEHVPDMVGTLKAASAKLAPSGKCLVRLPTTSSDAWNIYGAEWVSCDPPRHIVVPSRQGMAIAADVAELRVEQTFDDSSSYQFFASELARRDVPVGEIRGVGDIVRHFGWKQLWDWERQSERLNERSRGEQTGFLLTAKAG